MNVKKRMNTRTTLASALLLLLFLIGGAAFTPFPASADDKMDAVQMVERAKMTFDSFMVAPETEAFRNLIGNAKGVFVAPQILRGAFIVGASGGSGALVAKDPRTGKWMGPAFYTMGTASFGLQIGADASEVILLAMTDRGATALLGTSVKLGADIGVAVGPVGVGISASTANLSADILAFSRSKGLYGGISLDGAVVAVRNDWNDAYYGKAVNPTDILVLGAAVNPQASLFLDTVAKATGK